MTFDEFFIEFNITREERMALVWHLAAFRARRTVETLMDDANYIAYRQQLLDVLRK